MNSVSHDSTALPMTLVHTPSTLPNRNSAGTLINGSCVPTSSTGCCSSNFMRPLFHFTAHDTVIIAMEHNNHGKLLAISTSKNEVFVMSTRNMPVEEALLTDEEHLKWDPASSILLIEHLRYPCTCLAWAPWQYGMYLACVCRGKQVRFYRQAHGHWSLDDVLTVPDCISASFSLHFTMACACAKGKVMIFAQVIENEGNVWSPVSTYSQEDKDTSSNPLENRNRSIKGYTCCEWDETGTLLVVGDEEGVFRVLNVTGNGKNIGAVAYVSEPFSGRGRCLRQVSWSPGAGRSFLVLAAVFSYQVSLFFFKRPPLGGGVQTSAGDQLILMAKATVSMEEVTQLSWNTNGTRFITAHTDGAVSVWSVNVSYQRNQQVPLTDVVRGGGGGGGGVSSGANKKNGNTTNSGMPWLEEALTLVTSIRKVSVVHPYHGARQ
ncbi:uncharacterized protein TM35_000015250 [Trypanosoma theileri]|uniref:Uncharacterized protein n=1 Tax=Trypanosoma theileri TaxID=67003 RepID=A0A1X0P9T6_9TRYP|nr:uncharacterized protein TM35_000015250 [Trypanosoma theileri]ORC93648.1 hypothetical protein TM35_000015250 [Trypanosoma theileri]